MRAHRRGSCPLVAGGVTASGESGKSVVGRFDNSRGEPCGDVETGRIRRVHTPLEPVVLAATLALIPILIIEADATSSGWQEFATVANWVVWGIFPAELAAVLVVARRRRAALRAHWLDVAIVVLTIPLFSKVFAWLRLARFFRLASLRRLVARALQAEKRLTSGDSLVSPRS